MTAFEATGEVPWRHVRYDNLSPAVAKVLTGRSRTETARWLSFRSWYKSARSIVSQDKRELMKKAVWKERSGGFAAAGWSSSRRSARWPS